MASSLAVRRTPLLGLPIRGTVARRAAGYRYLSAATTPLASTSTHRTTQQSRILQRCAAGGRMFSTTGARQAEIPANMKRMLKDMQRHKAMPSARTMQKQNLDELPTDVGLMPDTFVRPTGASVPGLLPETKLRLKMEYHWAKTRFFDIVSRMIYKFTSKKPRPVINRFGLPKLALQLHKDMYTAFAYGDVEHLSRICTDGILNTFRTRINSRKPNERFYWARLSHSRPQMVSDRVVKLPVPGVDTKDKPCFVRQLIFRIESEQALVKGYLRKDRKGRETLEDAAGNELPVGEDGEVAMERMRKDARSVQEYLVLQKRMWFGKEEEWFAWGFVDESSVDKLE